MKSQSFGIGFLASLLATTVTLVPARASAHQTGFDTPATNKTQPGGVINSIPDDTFTYCQSTPNSTGRPCAIDAIGSVSLAENDFTLLIRGAPPLTTGMFFYGQGQAHYPAGDGYLCVSPHHPGLVLLQPGSPPNAAGIVRRRLDFATLSGAGLIAPGSTWYFQYMYRDLTPTGTGFNLSDGLCAKFAP